MRRIRPLTCPSQAITAGSRGYSTGVPLDQEVWLVHFREDGPRFPHAAPPGIHAADQISLFDFAPCYHDMAKTCSTARPVTR